MFTIRILRPRPVSELIPAAGDERCLRNELNEALLRLIRGELDDMAFSGEPI